MTQSETWYVVKQDNGQCSILTEEEIKALANSTPATSAKQQEQWGPYPSQAEAIARRVGLIRAGKCQPV